jgi:hypothetical protein
MWEDLWEDSGTFDSSHCPWKVALLESMEIIEIQAADITSLDDYHKSEGCLQGGKTSSTARPMWK